MLQNFHCLSIIIFSVVIVRVNLLETHSLQVFLKTQMFFMSVIIWQPSVSQNAFCNDYVEVMMMFISCDRYRQ